MYIFHFGRAPPRPAAQIGFEETVYTVDEEAGYVTVVVAVLEGNLTKDVINLTTAAGTANNAGTSDIT